MLAGNRFALLCLFVWIPCFCLTVSGAAVVFVVRTAFRVFRGKDDMAGPGRFWWRTGFFVSFATGAALGLAAGADIRAGADEFIDFSPLLLVAFLAAGCVVGVFFSEFLAVLMGMSFLASVLFVLLVPAPAFSGILFLRLAPYFCAAYLGGAAASGVRKFFPPQPGRRGG